MSRRVLARVLGLAPGLAAAELGLPMAALAEREPGQAGAYRLYAQIYAVQGRAADAKKARAAAETLGG